MPNHFVWNAPKLDDADKENENTFSLKSYIENHERFNRIVQKVSKNANSGHIGNKSENLHKTNKYTWSDVAGFDEREQRKQTELINRLLNVARKMAQTNSNLLKKYKTSEELTDVMEAINVGIDVAQHIADHEQEKYLLKEKKDVEAYINYVVELQKLYQMSESWVQTLSTMHNELCDRTMRRENTSKE